MFTTNNYLKIDTQSVNTLPVLVRCGYRPPAGWMAVQRQRRPETDWSLQNWVAAESAGGRWWWAQLRLLVPLLPLYDGQWVVLMSAESKGRGGVTCHVTWSKLLQHLNTLLLLLRWAFVCPSYLCGQRSWRNSRWVCYRGGLWLSWCRRGGESAVHVKGRGAGVRGVGARWRWRGGNHLQSLWRRTRLRPENKRSRLWSYGR